MTSTELLWNFFIPLAEATPGVVTVNRSGGDKMDRMLQASHAENIYPAVFLLRPKYSLEDNGASQMLAWFDCTFYVICTGQMDEEASEDAAFDEAEQLATAIVMAIRAENNSTCLVDPATKTFMEPVTMLTLDASYGYEVRFRFALPVNNAVYATV